MSSLSIYAARESGLHKLNPLTKFTLTLSLFVLGFALPGIWASYLVLFLIVVPLAVWGRVLRQLSQIVMSISWPLVLSVLIIQSLFLGRGDPVFEFGPFAPKLEGVLQAVTSAGRILLVMADFVLFSLATRPDTLMIALKQSGLPAGLAYIIVTTLQLVPRFVTKANTILDAQRSRGLETQGNMLVRARALLPLVLPLVIGSLLEVEERAIAIEARAFNSTKKETSLIDIPDPPLQRYARFGLILTMLVVIAYRLL